MKKIVMHDKLGSFMRRTWELERRDKAIETSLSIAVDIVLIARLSWI